MSSTMQDPPDSVLLVSFGELIMDAVVQTCTFTPIYGVFILLFSQTTVTYLKRKQRSQAQHWMFAASAASFLIATIYEAAQLVGMGIIIPSVLVGYQGLSLLEKQPLVNRQLVKPNIIISWTSAFETIISDAIVVWRAIVLLQHRKWLTILPLVLLLASFASYLVFLIFASARANVYDGLANNFLAAGAGLSLATNVVATTLIGYVYWGDMAAGLERHRTTQVERVLILLVEFGIVFCLLQAPRLILELTFSSSDTRTAGDYVGVVFFSASTGFSAIYPTVVIALVNNHRTFDHMYFTNASLPTRSNGTNPQHTTTIQFAQPDPATSSRTLPERVEKSQDLEGA